MAWQEYAGRVARGSVRYVWLFLIYASIFTLAMADEDPTRGRLLITWITCFIMLFMMSLGSTVTDELLEARLAGPRPLSWQALTYSTVVTEGWVVLGVAMGGLLMRPFAPADLLAFVGPIVLLVSLFGAPMTVFGVKAYEGYRALREREAKAQQAALAAQVEALQARIQPHFLFNSLNTVASLIEEDPKRAEAAVVKLADLFRYTLDASNQRFVPLSQELEMVQGFVDLETLRHPERLKVGMHLDPSIGDVSVPPLVLQPVVENAVLHGIAPRREGGRLEIEVRCTGGALHLSVEDDGPGPGASSHRGAGTALRDLRKRLSLLYGDRAVLSEGAGALGGYRVEIQLPIHDEEVES